MATPSLGRGIPLGASEIRNVVDKVPVSFIDRANQNAVLNVGKPFFTNPLLHLNSISLQASTAVLFKGISSSTSSSTWITRDDTIIHDMQLIVEAAREMKPSLEVRKKELNDYFAVRGGNIVDNEDEFNLISEKCSTNLHSIFKNYSPRMINPLCHELLDCIINRKALFEGEILHKCARTLLRMRIGRLATTTINGLAPITYDASSAGVYLSLISHKIGVWGQNDMSLSIFDPFSDEKCIISVRGSGFGSEDTLLDRGRGLEGEMHRTQINDRSDIAVHLLEFAKMLQQLNIAIDNIKAYLSMKTSLNKDIQEIILSCLVNNPRFRSK